MSAIDTFLDAYSPEVRALALATRSLVAEICPKIEETVDAKAKLVGYGYGPGYKGSLFVVIMSKNGVKLGVVRGAELPDPRGLLQGAGKVHRHVPIKTMADLKQPGLKPLCKSALAAWKKRNKATAR